MIARDIADHIQMLSTSHPDISSVWLFGSRANGTERSDSDWDFLVFATVRVLYALRRDRSRYRPDVDLLVVTDGDNFESPWPRADKPGRYKRGHLYNYYDPKIGEVEGLNWKEEGTASARYMGYRESRDLAALRVFLRNHAFERRVEEIISSRSKT